MTVTGFVMSLFFSLKSAGCETSLNVKGCHEGWLEFKCNYPRKDRKYERIKIENLKKPLKPTNKWLNIGKLSLFHDTRKKELRVSIKSLQQEQKNLEFEFLPSEDDEQEVEVSAVGKNIFLLLSLKSI